MLQALTKRFFSLGVFCLVSVFLSPTMWRNACSRAVSPSYLTGLSSLPGSAEVSQAENWVLPRHSAMFAADALRSFSVRHFLPGAVRVVLRHRFRNLRFLPANNDQILFYAKGDPDGGNVLLIPVNLDPLNPQACTVTVPPEVVGVAPGQHFRYAREPKSTATNFDRHCRVGKDVDSARRQSLSNVHGVGKRVVIPQNRTHTVLRT